MSKPTPTKSKVTRSIALDKTVAAAASRMAKAENRSFSNFVETVMTEAVRPVGKKPTL